MELQDALRVVGELRDWIAKRQSAPSAKKDMDAIDTLLTALRERDAEIERLRAGAPVVDSAGKSELRAQLREALDEIERLREQLDGSFGGVSRNRVYEMGKEAARAEIERLRSERDEYARGWHACMRLTSPNVVCGHPRMMHDDNSSGTECSCCGHECPSFVESREP